MVIQFCRFKMLLHIALASCLFGLALGPCIDHGFYIDCHEKATLNNIPQGSQASTVTFTRLWGPSCFSAAQVKERLPALRNIEVGSTVRARFCRCLSKGELPCNVWIFGCGTQPKMKECPKPTMKTDDIDGRGVSISISISFFITGTGLAGLYFWLKKKSSTPEDVEMQALWHSGGDDDSMDFRGPGLRPTAPQQHSTPM